MLLLTPFYTLKRLFVSLSLSRFPFKGQKHPFFY